MQKARLPILEEIVYYLAVVLSFGAVWLTKVIIVKAILDATNRQKV